MRSTAFDRPVSSVFHGKRSEALRYNREPRHSGSSFSSESRSETHKPGRTIQALRSCVRTSCYSVYLRGDERWTPPSHSDQLKLYYETHSVWNPWSPVICIGVSMTNPPPPWRGRGNSRIVSDVSSEQTFWWFRNKRIRGLETLVWKRGGRRYIRRKN